MRSAVHLLFGAVIVAGCAPPQTNVQAQHETKGSVVTDREDRPEWNQDVATDLVGASVLVGITYLRADGAFDSQVQMFGTITSAHPIDGVAIALDGRRAGETYHLPPDLRGFEAAAPGSYRLRSTGETVENPDYLVSWTITRPQN